MLLFHGYADPVLQTSTKGKRVTCKQIGNTWVRFWSWGYGLSRFAKFCMHFSWTLFCLVEIVEIFEKLRNSKTFQKIFKTQKFSKSVKYVLSHVCWKSRFRYLKLLKTRPCGSNISADKSAYRITENVTIHTFWGLSFKIELTWTECARVGAGHTDTLMGCVMQVCNGLEGVEDARLSDHALIGL